MYFHLYNSIVLSSSDMEVRSGDSQVSSEGRISSRQKRFVVIREVYENGHSSEEFEAQLDCALYEGVSLILIEPTSLGEETARWITVGNFFHKTGVLCGLGSIGSYTISRFISPKFFPFATPGPLWSVAILSCGVSSFLCAALYTFGWQWDPCCKYQVERDMSRLKDVLPLSRLTSAAPVILTRRDDLRRKILHNSIAFLSIAACTYHVYEFWRS